jgi:hypothetical protein
LLNFKGTLSQERQKTIFSGLKINKMALSVNKIALSGYSDATALFSTARYTLCDTYIDFRSLSILESQLSKTSKAVLRGKGDI